jgi:hypothetical protein
MTKKQSASLAIISSRQQDVNTKQALKELTAMRRNTNMTKEELEAGLAKVSSTLTNSILTRSPSRRKRLSKSRRSKKGSRS